MTKILFSLSFLLVFIYFVIGVMLYTKQRSFIYFPVNSDNKTLDEVVFNNGGETIRVSILNRGAKDAIIYFGGNAENVDYNAPQFSRIFTGHTVFLVKYRGYGGSTGKPTEKALYTDALYIFDQLKQQYDSVSVIGRSLGSGIATMLASRRDIYKLVLITPFDSLQNVAKRAYPLYPISLLLTDKYDSLGRVKSIKAETLVLMAENDEVIARDNTEELIRAFKPHKVKLEVITGRGHNNISDSEEFYSFLKNFI